MKFSMLLQAIDRVTAPARRMQASMRGVGQSAKAMAADLRSPDRAYQRGYVLGTRLRANLDRLVGGFARAGQAAARYAGSAGLAAWTKGTQAAGNGVLALGKKMGGLGVTAAKWAGAATVGAIGFSLFDMFGTASKFEQYQITLEGIEGSSQKAKKSLDWVADFAQRTPYELAEVMDSFVKLKSYGLEPLDGSLKASGDAASGMSKSIDQAVEALADASNRQYERLREFGITAEVTGDKVALTYHKAGRAITETARQGTDAANAVKKIWDIQFGGMMDRQSTTFAGLIANLKDKWTGFLLKVAQGGIFDLVKKKLQGLLDKINEWEASGQLKIWADQLSKSMEDAVKWATSFTRQDWERVGREMSEMARDLRTIASALAEIIRAVGGTDSALGLNGGKAFQNYWVTEGPFKFLEMQDRPPDKHQKWQPGGGPRAPGFEAPLPLLNPAARPWRPRPRKISAEGGDVGGKVHVAVSLDPGLKGRVTAVKSTGSVPINAQLGRTMLGSA